MASTQTETKKKKNTKAPKASRRNAVGDFLVEHIDGALMRKYIDENKIAIDVDGVDDEQLAVALVVWFKDNTAKEDWVRCDVCQAVSSADLESCPFCGDGGEVEAADDDEDEGDDEVSATSDRSDVDEDDSDDESEEDDDDVPGADLEHEGDDEVADAKEHDLADDDAPADDVEVIAAPPSEPEVTTTKATKKNTEKEDAKMTSVQTNGAGPKKSTALARASRTEVVTAKDLDKAVHEVEKLKKEISESIFDAAESHYQLGKKLLEMNEGQLWKMRVDDNNKPAYKSWDQFVAKELGMSPQQSYAAIDIARGYDSSDTLRAIGQTKAWRILQAAPQDRAALIEEAKAGASVRQINTKVQTSRKKHGSPKAGKVQQAKAGAASAKTTAAKKKTNPEKVSVTSFEGVKTVKLYARPESMKGVDLSKLKRAKTIGDKPFGRVELANGLVQILTIVKDPNDQLIVKIETRREG